MLCVRPAIKCPALQLQPTVQTFMGCQNMAGFSCSLRCTNGGMPSVNGVPLRNGMIFCQVDGMWSTNPSTISCGAGGRMTSGNERVTNNELTREGMGVTPSMGYQRNGQLEQGTQLGQGTRSGVSPVGRGTMAGVNPVQESKPIGTGNDDN